MDTFLILVLLVVLVIVALVLRLTFMSSRYDDIIDSDAPFAKELKYAIAKEAPDAQSIRRSLLPTAKIFKARTVTEAKRYVPPPREQPFNTRDIIVDAAI